VRDGGAEAGPLAHTGGEAWIKSSRLPIHVSDSAANSLDGSSQEFVGAAAARECNIQDVRGGGL
jgi:hypothetical protein